MKRSGAVVVVAATVLLALWVTAGASRVSILTPRPLPSDDDRERELAERSGPAGGGELQREDQADALPGWLDLLMQALSIAFVSVLVASLAWAAWESFRRRRRYRTALARHAQPEHVVHDQFYADAQRELAAAAADQLLVLRSGEPRNSIVACWIALEDAVERAGVPRNPAETTTEFTARVVQSVTIDQAVVSDLAALYREARFSSHPLDEHHRDRAIALLTRLSQDLDIARRAPTASHAASHAAAADEHR